MTLKTPNFLTCPGVPELSSASPSSSVKNTGAHEPVPPQKKPVVPLSDQPAKRRAWWKWIILIVVAAFLAVTVPPAIALARAGVAANDAKVAIALAREQVATGDFVSASTSLRRARTDLERVQSVLKGVGFWRDAPGIGTQIRAVEDASAAGSGALDAISDLTSVFGSVTDALRGGSQAAIGLDTGIAPTRRFQDLTKEEKRDVARAFANALPSVRIARDKIDLALELWDRVPQNDLIAPLRTAIQPLANMLPTLKRTLDESVPLLEVAVPLAGATRPMRSLVLLQNADELRPSGGFIGTLGRVDADAGDLTTFDFFDVYKVDGLVTSTWRDIPPAPIAQRLGVPAWFLRDSNWSPDFPTSAARVLDVYQREIELGTGKPLGDPPTTAIAIEPGFFASLLKITGPVTVAGNTYDATNFFDKIEYDVEIGFLKEGIPVAERKERLSQIGSVILDRVKGLPASRWPELIDAFTTSLHRKQIQIFSKDAELLAALDRYGWSGRTKPADQDFLWVIDANLAALKTDGVMKKSVAYRLDAADPSNAIATVTLTYTNTNRVIDWQHTRYRSYTRVFVPEGSELISSSGAMKDDRYRTGGVIVPGTVDVFKDLGKTVFGAFWSIEPGRTGTLSFTYKLPPQAIAKIADGSYALDWPKQAGADETELTTSILFGKNIRSATPAEPSDKWGDAKYEYQTDSLEDRRFEITF